MFDKGPCIPPVPPHSKICIPGMFGYGILGYKKKVLIRNMFGFG